MERQYLFPAEVVAGVLAFLAFLQVEEIPSRKKILHSAFYDMREQGLEVLSRFRFDTRGMFPYSPTLEQATSNLATSLLLERNNPRLNAYRITDKLKNHFENHVKPKTSDDERDQMLKIADYVRGKL